MVLPIQKDIAEMIINSPKDTYKLSQNDLCNLSSLRLQVREEIRKEKLVKGHRSLEVTFPLPRNNKRKAMEMEIMQKMKKKMKTMSDEDLELFHLTL